MTSALVVIDVQQDYFPGGAFPLVGPEEAARAAGRVLAAAREAGLVVVHVQHHSLGDVPFLRPGTPGADIHPSLTPGPGEALVVKHAPNSFLGTGLEDLLRERGVEDLVVVGMMTSMCVDSTVRSAAERGFAVTVVADACAAPDLELGGVRVPGDLAHTAFLAALGSGFARVVTSADLVEDLGSKG
ncbi:cysteine hydrolase family protein [Kineococcus sp. LSe6-4]|uniref:Cysteine hydrolase family protein n=1 Tax=Kineococcus halophytocola TaxID=3234027 RepID=A0ABV4H3D2_9ACTN